MRSLVKAVVCSLVLSMTLSLVEVSALRGVAHADETNHGNMTK